MDTLGTMRSPKRGFLLTAVLALAAAAGPASLRPAYAAQMPPAPLPLVAGAKVVTLWPAGSPTLKAVDTKEVFTMTEGQPTRVQKVVEVHNPSIELHLAPKGKATGVGIVLGGRRDVDRGL